MVPTDRFYTLNHQWLRPEDSQVTIGVTPAIIKQVRPIVALQILDADDEMKSELPYAEIEGQAASFQIYPPIETNILEVNSSIVFDLEKLETDPYGEGWLLRIGLKDPKSLHSFMTASVYKKYCLEKLGKGWDA